MAVIALLFFLPVAGLAAIVVAVRPPLPTRAFSTGFVLGTVALCLAAAALHNLR